MPKDIIDYDTEFLTEDTLSEARQLVETVVKHGYGAVSDQELIETYQETVSLMNQMDQSRNMTSPAERTDYDASHAPVRDDRMEPTGDAYSDIAEAVSLGKEYLMKEFNHSELPEISDNEAAGLLEP